MVMQITKTDVDKLATELSLELLPQLIVEIAELIGIEKTLQLVQAFGGTNLLMPKGVEKSSSKQALIHAVGEETAQALMEIYGGDRLYIARCEVALRDWRDNQLMNEIGQLVMNDMSQTKAIRHVAVKYGISERWVYELLKTDMEKRQYQQDLLF